MRRFDWMYPIFAPKNDEGGNGGGAGEGKGDEDKPKPKNEPKDDNGNEPDPEEAKTALSLYRALKDPETGLELIETLAKRAGILDKKGEPKESKKETRDELDSISKKFLQEALGKDYEVFADKVGPVLDKIIKHYLEDKFSSAEHETTENKWSEEVDSFIDNHFMNPKIEATMKELMDDAPPNIKRKGFNAQKYLNRIYKQACEELKIEPKTKGKKSESRRNEDDDDEIPGFVVRERPNNLTLDDAVDAAIKGIRYKRSDE